MRIHECDYDYLRAEGWEIGSYWSHSGACGHYIRHADHFSGDWIKVSHTPCQEDSLLDEKGDWISPLGFENSATDALLGRILEDFAGELLPAARLTRSP
ncbi:MAG TPA: hypothetical protein VGY91_07015 [Chthoniobacterales bacterium]|jgi:hypothetical protein|nr:hypothetical protein [Chthoniobacterales bacterium]